MMRPYNNYLLSKQNKLSIISNAWLCQQTWYAELVCHSMSVRRPPVHPSVKGVFPLTTKQINAAFSGKVTIHHIYLNHVLLACLFCFSLETLWNWNAKGYSHSSQPISTKLHDKDTVHMENWLLNLKMALWNITRGIQWNIMKCEICLQ